MATLIHPTPGSILNQFATPEPALYPHLAFPFHHTLAGKTATFVSDGAGVVLWTRRRLPGYRDWLPGHDIAGLSPAQWVAMAIGGASHPLPRTSWQTPEAMRMLVCGQVAYIPHHIAMALNAFDTCYVGPAKAKATTPGLPVPSVTVHWTFGAMAGEGIVICDDAPSLTKSKDKPKAK
jgi:hypothetical protein